MNPLDTIIQAYDVARAAIKVVRRCINLPTIDENRPFRNTYFYNKEKQESLGLLDSTESELDDLTVLDLYAAFECAIKEALAAPQVRIGKAKGRPLHFAAQLRTSFTKWIMDDLKMDKAVEFFTQGKIDDTLLAQIGQIREYRHWVAHGRRWKKPPKTSPKRAYEILTKFLFLAGIVNREELGVSKNRK